MRAEKLNVPTCWGVNSSTCLSCSDSSRRKVGLFGSAGKLQLVAAAHLAQLAERHLDGHALLTEMRSGE